MTDVTPSVRQVLLLVVSLASLTFLYGNVPHMGNKRLIFAPGLSVTQLGNKRLIFDPDIIKVNISDSQPIPYLDLVNRNKTIFPDPTETEIPFEKKVYFSARLTPAEKNLTFSLLNTFHDVMTKNNLTYFIEGGTLLGSYRHHDLIPWDDDTDVMVPRSQRGQVFAAFNNLTDVTLYDFWREIPPDVTSSMAKLSSVHGRRYARGRGDPRNLHSEYTFPYMDVSFHDENETHLWSRIIEPTPKSVVFPLVTRPLNRWWYPAPRDPHAYLKHQGVEIEDCYSGGWDHKAEIFKLSETVPCGGLRSEYPFVRHVKAGGGQFCKEVLSLGNTVIDTFLRSAKDIPVC